MEDTIEKYLTWAKWANETGPVEDWMDIDLLRDRLENEDLDKHPNVKKGDRLYIKAVARAANVIALYEREKWWYYPDEISVGSYPLDKLPDHIRDLAFHLYYKKEE